MASASPETRAFSTSTDVRTWKIEGKSEKDVITRDCMGLDHAECLVDDHLEEMAYLLADARAEFGF